MRISPNELIIVLLIVLVIFGPKQIPKLAKMFGKATKSFKDGIDNAEEDDETKTTNTAAAATEEKPAEKKTEDKAE